MGVVVAARGVVRAYQRDIQAAHQRLVTPPVPVHRLPMASGIVEYARYGQGQTVLVVHGNGGGWDQGVDWARRRLDGQRDVIAVSRFGYLGSTLPPGATVEAQADAFAELLDRLGLDRVDVAGLSAGSLTAVPFAARHPDRTRSLVLESPVLPTEHPPPLPRPAAVRVLVHAQPLVWALIRSPLLVGLSAGVPWRRLDEAQRAELRAITDTALPLPPRAAGMVFDSTAAPDVIADRIAVERVLAPTLVINATDAKLAPRADALAFVERLADGQLLDVPTGGHVLVGNVDYLRGVLAEFLDRPDSRLR